MVSESFKNSMSLSLEVVEIARAQNKIGGAIVFPSSGRELADLIAPVLERAYQLGKEQNGAEIAKIIEFETMSAGQYKVG